MTRDAELPAGDYLGFVLDSIASGARDLAPRRHSQAGPHCHRPVQPAGGAGRPTGRSRGPRRRSCCDAAEPASDFQVIFARAYARSAAAGDDATRLQGWLDGRDVPDGLAIDPELRWLIVKRLAVVGAAG